MLTYFFLLVLLCGNKAAENELNKTRCQSVNWWQVYFFMVSHYNSLKEWLDPSRIYSHFFIKDNVKKVQMWNVWHCSAFEPGCVSSLSWLISARWSSDIREQLCPPVPCRATLLYKAEGKIAIVLFGLGTTCIFNDERPGNQPRTCANHRANICVHGSRSKQMSSRVRDRDCRAPTG